MKGRALAVAAVVVILGFAAIHRSTAPVDPPPPPPVTSTTTPSEPPPPASADRAAVTVAREFVYALNRRDLPRREWRSGYSEYLTTAAIADFDDIPYEAPASTRITSTSVVNSADGYVQVRVDTPLRSLIVSLVLDPDVWKVADLTEALTA